MKKLHTTISVLIFLIFNSSAWSVINGLPIAESEFPAVQRLEVHLYNEKRELFIGDCQTTAITSRLFITAAHCFNNEEGYVLDHGYVRFPDRTEKFTVDQTFSHPHFNPDEPSYYTDLALIFFDTDVTTDTVKLASTPLQYGDMVQMVGHGIYDIVTMEGDYTKRRGTNTYTQTELADYFKLGGTIELQGFLGMQEEISMQGQKSNCGPGDSGGPLFNEQGELVGICKAGVALNETTSTAIYIDLLSPESLFFFEKAQEEGISLPPLGPESDSAEISPES